MIFDFLRVDRPTPKAALEQQRQVISANIDKIEKSAREARVGKLEEGVQKLRGLPITGTLESLKGMTDAASVADMAVVAAAGATVFYKSPDAEERMTLEQRTSRAEEYLKLSLDSLKELQRLDAADNGIRALKAYARVVQVDPLVGNKAHHPELRQLFDEIEEQVKKNRMGRSIGERVEQQALLIGIKRQFGLDNQVASTYANTRGEMPGAGPDMPTFANLSARERAMLHELIANGQMKEINLPFAGWLPVVKDTSPTNTQDMPPVVGIQTSTDLARQLGFPDGFPEGFKIARLEQMMQESDAVSRVKRGTLVGKTTEGYEIYLRKGQMRYVDNIGNTFVFDEKAKQWVKKNKSNR